MPKPETVYLRTAKLVLILAVPALAACAGQPPPPELNQSAAQAIARAEAAEAEQYAPLELRFAREKLQAAEAAIAAGEYEPARRQLEQAEIDAELALVRSRAEIGRLGNEKLIAEIAELRRQLEENFGPEQRP